MWGEIDRPKEYVENTLSTNNTTIFIYSNALAGFYMLAANRIWSILKTRFSVICIIAGFCLLLPLKIKK